MEPNVKNIKGLRFRWKRMLNYHKEVSSFEWGTASDIFQIPCRKKIPAKDCF